MLRPIDVFIENRYIIEITHKVSTILRFNPDVPQERTLLLTPDGTSSNYVIVKSGRNNTVDTIRSTTERVIDLKELRDLIQATCGDLTCYIVDESQRKIISLLDTYRCRGELI